jgi:hypothetical protein
LAKTYSKTANTEIYLSKETIAGGYSLRGGYKTKSLPGGTKSLLKNYGKRLNTSR